MDWIHYAEDTVQWRSRVVMVVNFRILEGERTRSFLIS